MATDTGLAAGRVLIGGILGAGWSQASGAVTTGLQNFDTWGSATGVTHVSEVTTMYVGGSLTTSSVTAYTASLSGYTGHVIWSIGGFPSSDSSPTYAKLLAGTYDSNFTQVFTAIASATPNATARPFWELEGNWFTWGQGLRSSNGYSDSLFAQAWDHVHALGVAAGFTGTWDFNARLYNGWDPANIPITAANYDVISADQYSMGTLASQSVQSAWTNNDLPVYNKMASIAARDGKRVGFSEIATGYRQDGSSMGDDDYWLTQLAAFVKAHDTAYFAYFNDNDPTGGGTTITNRFQMAVPATLYQPSAFSTSSYFPKTAAVWRSQFTSANLAFVAAPPPVVPIPATHKRTTRFVFADTAATVPVTTLQPLVRSGTQVTIGGTRYQTTGWDSYVMRSAGGTPAQTMTDAQRDAFFSSLAPNSLVRVWAFPPKAGTYTDAQALAEQDKIVTSARTYGHRLVMCLADWAGNANDDTGVKTVSWLTGQTYTGRYQSWLDTIVARYASDNTVAVWDLLNEPIAPSNTTDLLTFVNAMGARVKAADANALVMLGINTPAISCGSTANYQTVMGSSQIDLVTFHDYYEVPGISDTFVAARGVAQALGKPLLIDEVGVWASASYTTATTSPAGYTPVSYANQANILKEKLRLYAGYPEIVGALVWSEMEASIPDPAYEPQPGAATRTTIHDFPMSTGGSFTPATVAGLEGWVKGVDAWRIANGAATGGKLYRRGTANSYATTWTAVHAETGTGKAAWQPADASAVWLDWPAIDAAQTWFLVVKPTTLTSGAKHYLVGADNGSGGLAVYIDGTTGKVNLLNEGSAPFGVSTTALAAGTAYLIEAHLTKSTGTWSVYLNGTLDASGTATVGTFAASSNTSLLRQFTWQAGNSFAGYLFEAMKFSTDVSATDAATVRSYLMAEYGLSAIPTGGSGNPRDSLTITSGTQINATNTGYSSSLLQGPLTTVGALGAAVNTTYSTAGQTIRDTEFHGMVTVNAANVTFKNCIFHGRNSTVNEACVMANTSAVANTYFEDCTFIPDYPSIWVNGINGSDFTLNRCNISNTVDGAGVFNTTRAQPYASNVKVLRTYIHDLAYFSPDSNHTADNQTHNDGVQLQGGTGTTIQFSNIQSYYGTAGSAQPTPNTSPTPSGYASVALSCVMFNVNVGDTSGAVITDNAFGGGYIPLNCSGGATNLGTMLRNKFDGGSLIMSGAKPQTITLGSTQTATTGAGTTDANTFYAGTYAGQEILVRGGASNQPYGSAPQALATWTLTFSDDFTGTSVDTTKWNVFDGKTQNNVTCRAANVSVANSILSLQLSDSSTGAEMATGSLDGWGTDKYRFPVGGYTEARVYFPGDGTNLYNWPAWWTSGLNWSVNGELDIAEVLSGLLTMNYHHGTGGVSGDIAVGGPQLSGATWGNGWHIFGAYRGSSSLNFYWDGVLQWSTTPQDAGGSHVLILNIGAHSSNTLVGSGGALQVDYVRAWEPAGLGATSLGYSPLGS